MSIVNKTTPSEQSKFYGCKGLRHLSEITGVSEQTLINWHESRPDLFKIICVGAAKESKKIMKSWNIEMFACGESYRFGVDGDKSLMQCLDELASTLRGFEHAYAINFSGEEAVSIEITNR